MLGKLTDKLKQKLEDRPSPAGGNGGLQAQAPQGPLQREPLGTGSKREIFRYRYWRGVNLGSWFTLEQWITPRPFDGAKKSGDADWDIAAGSLSVDDKRRALEAHWDAWITDNDFAFLASRGVNTVRLPISYYHLAGLDPYLLKGTDFEAFSAVYAGAWVRIQRAFAMADKWGIGVLVDLHAVPGKQNEDAHAGVSHHGPQLLEKFKNQEATVRVLERLVGAITQIENVVGMELMNEPKQHPKLTGFHKSTLARLRRVCGPDFPLIVGDAWNLNGGLHEYFPDSNFTLIDTHVYRCFTAEDGRTPAAEHTRRMRNEFLHEMSRDEQLKTDRCGGRVIVGEWSGALNPGSMGGSHGGEADEKTRAFVRAQLDLWDKTTSGFFFWTYKKQEGWDAGWSFANECQAEIQPPFLGLRADAGKQADWDGGLARAKAQAMDAHFRYWDGVMPGRPMEHDRFAAGFTTAWHDNLRFLTSHMTHPALSASELPQAGGQWKVRRREEHVLQRGVSEWVWEWEQGWEQGTKAARDFWGWA